MRIGITGVAGMIGSHLSEILINKGFEVIGIDNLSVGKKENIQNTLSRPKWVSAVS